MQLKLTPRLGIYSNSGIGERVRGWSVIGDRGERVQGRKWGPGGVGPGGVVTWLARGPPKASVAASIN